MRGGKRSNAGRPKGSKTRKFSISEKDGITPLKLMLEVMRDNNAPIALRLSAAKSLAPYLYEKVASPLKNDPNQNMQIPLSQVLKEIDAESRIQKREQEHERLAKDSLSKTLTNQQAPL